MKLVYSLIIIIVTAFASVAQDTSTTKPILGISDTQLGSGVKGERMLPIFTKMIAEAAKATERFRVVDRSDYDNILREIELQKNEEFIGAEGVVDKDLRVGVPQLLTSTVVRMPIERIKNYDGSVRGYKASVTIALQVQNVESSVNYATKQFSAKTDKEYLSPEAALQFCADQMKAQVQSYIKTLKLQE